MIWHDRSARVISASPWNGSGRSGPDATPCSNLQRSPQRSKGLGGQISRSFSPCWRDISSASSRTLTRSAWVGSSVASTPRLVIPVVSCSRVARQSWSSSREMEAVVSGGIAAVEPEGGLHDGNCSGRRQGTPEQQGQP